ncbi:MAG TPA: NAD(P)-dependent oxidoreductase [Myxococcales bacterium]|nr:NAD(P)-dependent oxidoreductase [Myxococcales bacterium]
MNVLLTGALGMVGQRALAELLKAGHRVRALELPTPKNRKLARTVAAPGLELVWGDVRDELAMARAVDGQDAAAHLAAIIPPLSDARPDLAREVNVGGTRNLLQAMKRAGTRRLVFTSSVAVFARPLPQPPPRTVDDPTAGTDPYSHHKLECEGMIRASALDFCILRFGAVLPPAMPSVDLRVQMRMAFDIPLDQRIETVDAQDAGLAVANAVASPEVVGKTLLVGGGQGSQMLFREYIAQMLGAMGLKMFPDEAFGHELYHTEWMDSAEAQRLLRFQRHTFADFMSRYRAEQAAVRRVVSMVGPLAWPLLLRLSPYYRKAREGKA